MVRGYGKGVWSNANERTIYIRVVYLRMCMLQIANKVYTS